jgi:salicylate hydroxylase
MKADPVTAPLMEAANVLQWFAPGRHIVSGPVAFGDYFSMIVVFAQEYAGKPDTPPNARNWETKGDPKLLRKAFEDHEPRVRQTMNYVTEEECRIWNITMLPDLKTWVSPSGKVVLAGDAAHCMLPYMAQVSPDSFPSRNM